MSTPYTTRERRTNLAKLPEAYPGQHANTLESLIAHDVELAEQEREQAAVARAGGRLLTSKLAYRVEDFRAHYVTLPTGKDRGEHVEGETPIWIAALSGQLGPEKLADCWRLMIDGAGNYGRDSWRSEAMRAANVGTFAGHGPEDPSRTTVTLTEAEAMM